MRKPLIKSLYKNRSIRIKLLLNYVATVLFIVVILSVLNAKNLLFEVEGLLDRNTSQLIGQTRNSVEYYIRDLENMIFFIYPETRILQGMRVRVIANRAKFMKKVSKMFLKHMRYHTLK